VVSPKIRLPRSSFKGFSFEAVFIPRLFRRVSWVQIGFPVHGPKGSNPWKKTRFFYWWCTSSVNVWNHPNPSS
jgi:hypothetical protein